MPNAEIVIDFFIYYEELIIMTTLQCKWNLVDANYPEWSQNSTCIIGIQGFFLFFVGFAMLMFSAKKENKSSSYI